MQEIYVSTDIETDGPIPGSHSMLSFGSAAYLADKTLIGTFTANLQTLPGATGHPVTMKWWETQPEAWAACRQDPQPPGEVLPRYRDWIRTLPGRPIFVGYPVVFDFMFVAWYLHRFAGENPFGFSALDIKTYAMAMMGTEYRKAVKDAMPGHWRDPLPHTHVALDDALEQGALFCNILRESRGVSGVV